MVEFVKILVPSLSATAQASSDKIEPSAKTCPISFGFSSACELIVRRPKLA
jgi:hypothetical protein